MKAPKKQRFTTKRIYDFLVKDHHFEGSERTVREYVRKKQQEIYRSAEVAPEGFLQLVHDPGEAQVDFGQMVYYDDTNDLKTGHYLNVGFPYNNAGFAQIFKGENQECPIQGLINIFDYIGGEPPLLVFDNLNAGVVSIFSAGCYQKMILKMLCWKTLGEKPAKMRAVTIVIRTLKKNSR